MPLDMASLQSTSSPRNGESGMRVELKGLGSRTRKLADGRIRYYATAWRSERGAKAPVIARGDGRTLDEARAAAAAELATEAGQARLQAARDNRKARARPIPPSRRTVAGAAA